MYYNYDTYKIINVLLFIIQSLGGKADIARLFRLIFFADVLHLVKYGSLITGDTYITMYNGPTALHVYLLYQKLLTNNPRINFEKHVYEYFLLEGGTVRNLQKYDDSYISKSEVECIFETIRLHKDEPPENPIQKAKSDDANMQAGILSEVPIAELAKTGSNAMIKYITWTNQIKESNLIRYIFQANNNGNSVPLNIGSILRIDNAESEKRIYVVIGVSVSQCAFVEVIDSNEFPFEQFSDNLHACFVGLSDEYNDISTAAYIDCSKLYVVNYNKFKKSLKISSGIQIGEVNPVDFAQIRDAISSSNTISTKLKEEFFLL